MKNVLIGTSANIWLRCFPIIVSLIPIFPLVIFGRPRCRMAILLSHRAMVSLSLKYISWLVGPRRTLCLNLTKLFRTFAIARNASTRYISSSRLLRATMPAKVALQHWNCQTMKSGISVRTTRDACAATRILLVILYLMYYTISILWTRRWKNELLFQPTPFRTLRRSYTHIFYIYIYITRHGISSPFIVWASPVPGCVAFTHALSCFSFVFHKIVSSANDSFLSKTR